MADDKNPRVNWRLLDFECADGAWLMAADLYLYRNINRHPEPIIVRFYRFDPPAITLGYHQKAERAVDAHSCARGGVDIVRRPTGGRALLHRNEINYAVIADTARTSTFGPGLAEGFRRISVAIAQGLERLGLSVEVSQERRRAPSPARTPGGGLCAATTTCYEITCAAGKVVAAAQLRSTDRLLQHGTIYFDENEITPTELFGHTARTTKTVMVDLRRALGQIPSQDAILQALTDGFVGAFGPCSRRDGYEKTDRAGIVKLLVEKGYAPPKSSIS